MQDINAYDKIITKLRTFFKAKGFVEVPAQSRLSILAACEDPKTIAEFEFDGVNYPLPQTGQMWLEIELLKNSSTKGVFCVTTSYRNEPNPIKGRHDKIFPMFEFESKGNIEDLKRIESELLDYLGFEIPTTIDYGQLCEEYNVDVLEAEHEDQMCKNHGNSISLEKFPLRTHPFWNMKHCGNKVFNKVDVILYGMETIGSAERSCNAEEMKENFMNISGGQYAQLLFDKFGKERVMKELDEYLKLKMFNRFGGGIGITRLERAMKLARVL